MIELHKLFYPHFYLGGFIDHLYRLLRDYSHEVIARTSITSGQYMPMRDWLLNEESTTSNPEIYRKKKARSKGYPQNPLKLANEVCLCQLIAVITKSGKISRAGQS
jgi:hypothetical protein